MLFQKELGHKRAHPLEIDDLADVELLFQLLSRLFVELEAPEFGAAAFAQEARAEALQGRVKQVLFVTVIEVATSAHRGSERLFGRSIVQVI